MSNILVDELPTEIEIDGQDYPINTDFRFCIRTLLAFEDNELTGYEKQTILLANMYPEIPENVEAAIEQATRFLNGGEEQKEDDDDPLRLYSFSKDADFIFAAFRQTHGIDLSAAKMHWWKFLALFMDLGADTTFCNLVNLRKRLKTGKATKEERQMASEMKDMIDVPDLDTRTLDEREREAEFMRLIGQGR